MSTKQPVRILIVDDEQEIATILRHHLEAAGYVTVWARDGRSALDMLQKPGNDFVLTLLDIRMPFMNGVEVLRKIKDTENDIAVVMMSGQGSEQLVVECMKLGAIDYLTKPFGLEDMQQCVERALAYRQALLDNKRLEREKNDFISMLSHDMKNPLAAVIGSIDIIREQRLGPVNDEQADYLQAAIDGCNEVVAMIDNLLGIQRFEAGRMQLTLRPYDPVALIRSVLGPFVRMVEYERIVLVTELEEGLGEVLVDKSVFSRVIANLLANAIKFTPDGGEIRVSARSLTPAACAALAIPDYAVIPDAFHEWQSAVRISVHDTGSGIDKADLGRIFERFVQLEPSSCGRERGGSGLGLAFCKMAVERLGGVIWADSDKERGSDFIILLPCCNQQAEE